MKKQELIKHIEDLPYKEGPIVDKIYISRKGLLELVKQLDELQKPVIPQFVAEWIEVAKTVYSLSGGMTYGGPRVNKWLENEDNQRTFVLAWFDGYTVEKPKRYIVKMKGLNEDNSYLNYDSYDGEWYFTDAENGSAVGTHHTRKQLEEAGFGWVFDSPGFQIEEVE